MEQTTKHENEKHVLITTLLMQGEDSPIMKQIYKERCNRFHQYQPQSGYSIVKSYWNALLTEDLVADDLKQHGTVRFLDENRMFYDVGIADDKKHTSYADIELTTASGKVLTVEVKRLAPHSKQLDYLRKTASWEYFAYETADECIARFKQNYLHGADYVAIVQGNHITYVDVRNSTWTASEAYDREGKKRRLITVRY